MAHEPSAVRRLLKPVLGHPRVEPFTAQALRARQVRPGLRFLIRELRGGAPAPAQLYRLRRDPAIRVALRHHTGDVVTLGEIFHQLDYEPPAGVLATPPRRVLDLGANVGLFGAWAHHRWPGCAVTSYEPDPANAATLRATVAANPGRSWSIVEAAAGSADGSARFAAGEVALSHLVAGDGAAQAGEVEVAVRDVLGEIAASDLVKIDIEGGEWALWTDPRFAASPPPVLVAEYHEHLCPGPGDARDTAYALLRAAGYTIVPVVHHEAWGAGMLWAHR